MLRTSYDVTNDKLRLEAYVENKEFDETLDIDWDDLQIEVIGDRKNARFSNSITIDASDKTEDNNDDVKTVVDAFPGGRVEGNNT